MVTARTLALASIYQLGITAVAALGCAWRWREGLVGVAVGGGLMALNFWLVRFLGQRAMVSAQPRLVYVLALALKFVVMLGLIALAMTLLHPNPAALAAGMLTLFLGIALAALHQALSSKAAHST